MPAPRTVLPFEDPSAGSGQVKAAPARLLDLAIRAMNHCTRLHKDTALAGITGANVVELGVSGGSNLPWLPAGTRLSARSVACCGTRRRGR